MTHPRDHALALAAQLRSDLTVLANVTCKVRVNGGAATTYNSGSTPAVTQNPDIAYGYEVKIPANTYADGDVVEAAWLYSGTAYAYSTDVIGVAEVDGAQYTTARAAKLDQLDVAVSTRLATAGYTAPDNADIVTILADVVTLMARLPSDLLDEVVTSHNTANSVGKLLQFLDAAISSRLASSAYVGPDNADVATILTDVVAIKAKTDLLGTGSLTLVSPTAVAGKLDLIAGDDYKAADGRAITFPWSGPTLASVQLKIGTGLTVNGTPGAGSVSFDLTAAQTSALATPAEFTAIGTLTDGSKATVARGLCTVS